MKNCNDKELSSTAGHTQSVEVTFPIPDDRLSTFDKKFSAAVLAAEKFQLVDGEAAALAQCETKLRSYRQLEHAWSPAGLRETRDAVRAKAKADPTPENLHALRNVNDPQDMKNKEPLRAVRVNRYQFIVETVRPLCQAILVRAFAAVQKHLDNLKVVERDQLVRYGIVMEEAPPESHNRLFPRPRHHSKLILELEALLGRLKGEQNYLLSLQDTSDVSLPAVLRGIVEFTSE